MIADYQIWLQKADTKLHDSLKSMNTKATPHKGKTSIHVANVVKYRHE